MTILLKKIKAGFFITLLVFASSAYSFSDPSDNFYQHIQCIEIADTPEKMTKGLMWRTDLCENCGMLFVFKKERPVSMWMKNTPTSLDMIFMDNNGMIKAIFTHTMPFQEFPTYHTSEPVSYVLEMKTGFVDREQLKVGMQVDVGRLYGRCQE